MKCINWIPFERAREHANTITEISQTGSIRKQRDRFLFYVDDPKAGFKGPAMGTMMAYVDEVVVAIDNVTSMGPGLRVSHYALLNEPEQA